MKELTTEMSNNDISFDDLMNTIMDVTRRDAVLRCIRIVQPKYQIKYRDIDTVYNCKLLRNLRASHSRYQSPAKGVVTMDELQDMVRTQVDMEKRCNLKVKSVAPFTGDPNVRQQAVSWFYSKITSKINVLYIFEFRKILE